MQNIHGMLTNIKRVNFGMPSYNSYQCWLSVFCVYVLDVFPVFYADHSYVTLALPYNVTAQTIVDSIEDHAILGEDCLLCEVTSTGGLKINTITLKKYLDKNKFKGQARKDFKPRILNAFCKTTMHVVGSFSLILT